MQFYSLQKKAPNVDFRTATIHGQAPDGGLYFPSQIPFLPNDFLNEINFYSKEEVALEVISPYVGNSIPRTELQRIVAETVAFDFPLVGITEDISSLELFHGPTLAFKDVGARFMSRCLGYFVRGNNQKVTVLVATSGDTGGAVANGFFDVEGVDVVILYPSGKVSPIQELQLTTLGQNITALEVAGRFDDCQQMVKAAFADNDLQQALFLTSANSINVARWLPQQFYYFYAWQQWQEKENPPVISVPSGNFGNICAGILARQSGLPVKHFIAACNANDIVPQYLQSGSYQARQAVATLSNAMDVGNPSNFVRILEIFRQEFASLKGKLHAASITDEATKATLARVYNDHQYLLDPHGAVGYLALEQYLAQNAGQKGYLLETAHPVKFPEAVEEVTGRKIDYPDAVKGLISQEKKSIKMEPEFNALKEYLLSRR